LFLIWSLIQTLGWDLELFQIARRFDRDRCCRRIDIGESIGLTAGERRRYQKECSNAASRNATEHFDVPERPDAALECALPVFCPGTS
jgi:hypothetical protein